MKLVFEAMAIANHKDSGILILMEEEN